MHVLGAVYHKNHRKQKTNISETQSLYKIKHQIYTSVENNEVVNTFISLYV